jgi:hypothetical protein
MAIHYPSANHTCPIVPDAKTVTAHRCIPTAEAEIADLSFFALR